jgi:hypothetical protein
MNRFVFGGLFVAISVGCRPDTDFASPPRKSYEATAKYKNTFLASEVLDGQKEINEGGRYTYDTLVMRERPASSTTFQQVVRKESSVQKRQGRDSRISKEEFDVSSAGILDLLVVIDNSRSMVQERNALSTRLGPLVSSVQDTNWQIAIVSMSNPCVDGSNIVRSTDSNQSKKFADIVSNVPTDNDAKEQGFPMAIQALDSQCFGMKKWTRDNSAIGVLILSDEDNCGSDPGEQARCKNIYGKNADEMIQFLNGFRPVGQARVYGLIKENSSTCPNAPGVGTEYLKAINATGGDTGSICAKDYASSLTKISKNVKQIVKREFELEATPDMVDFRVEADGVPVNSSQAWALVGDTVIIDPEIFEGVKKVTFTYTHDAIPKFDRLPIVGSVALDSLVVKFNSAIQDPSFYSIAPGGSQIIFNPIPPDEQHISVSWREDKELKNEFLLEANDLIEESVRVKLDDKILDESEFKFEDNKVSFHEPPLDGAKIEVLYKTLEHKITKYRFESVPPHATVVTTSKNADSVIPSAYEDGYLVFSAESIVDGALVSVEVDSGEKPSSLVVDLPEETLPGTLSILVDGEEGRCRGRKPGEHSEPMRTSEHRESGYDDLEDNGKIGLHLEVTARKGSKLQIDCKIGDKDRSQIAVLYKYESPRVHEFKIDERIPLGDSQKPTGFRIFIDGRETLNFKRVGRTFTIDKTELGVGSKIDIEAVSWSRI